MAFSRDDYVEAVANLLRRHDEADKAVEQAKVAQMNADVAAFHLLAVSTELSLTTDDSNLAMFEGVERSGLGHDHWTTKMVFEAAQSNVFDDIAEQAARN